MERTVAVSDANTEAMVQIPFANVGLHAPDSQTRRLLGAYYTPQSAADYMADWIIRHDEEHILEPSFGDGIFLRALAMSTVRKNLNKIHFSGVEIDEKAKAHALNEGLITSADVRCEDFLSVAPFKVQAVIGNPPYVRLRRLANDQQQRARRVATTAMGQEMDPSGSLWMPFVLHAMNFLNIGGRLAFVLPYDFTYVRYARPLWKCLSNNFGSLQVLRTHERLFPDLLQDVVILLADNYGSQTATVRYQAFEKVQDLLEAHPIVDEAITVNDLLLGERAFISALLGKELRHLLNTRVADVTVAARNLVTFNIGYVAGDKVFFHPPDSDVNNYQIPSRSLRPSLTSARMLKGSGLRTSALGPSRMNKLFFPYSKDLTEGERLYIESGEKRGVSTRYKCRVRDPWYVVPGTRVPDVVLGVFTERPILLINDAKSFASNSLLCGYNVSATSEEIVTAWYTSLTLLQCELEVHALGGGVMVMVPREAGNIRLPKHLHVHENHLEQLDQLLRRGETISAYHFGDHAVLIEQLGFSKNDVDLIHHGIEVLAHWRTSARSSLG